jgi:hypothetical protein
MTISRASLDAGSRFVSLSTSAHEEGILYRLTVRNVEDLAGNPMPETSADYEFTPVTVTDGLVGYWAFDEGSGLTAGDSSGNENTGTLANGVTWTSGRLLGAVQFDGLDDCVEVGNFAASGSDGAGSLTFWLYLDSTDGDNYFFSADRDHYMAAMETSGYMRLQVRNAVSTNAIDITGDLIPTGEWAFHALTWDGTEAVIYLNGQAVRQRDTGTGPYTSLDGATLFIGHDRFIGERGADGALDDFRVYNRVLSPAEVLEVMGATAPDVTPTPTEVVPPDPTWTSTPTLTATQTPTNTATSIPTDTNTPTDTATPEPTDTPQGTATAQPEGTVTPTSPPLELAADLNEDGTVNGLDMLLFTTMWHRERRK